MNNPTRILIVEDLPADYELAQREIRKAVQPCTFQRVEQQGDFLKALEEFQPELILSDYMLPGFDGMEALKLAQRHCPSVPVIIWTGSMNEDVAVECVKRGASNYIIKENLKRLGPAITRALEERDLLLENRLTEEKYRGIFENATEGIFQSTSEGHFLSVNPAMARIYGYSSPAEMIEHITDISSQIYAEPETRSRFIELLQNNEFVRDFEMKNRRKDGRLIWTSTSARAVRDESGNLLYYEGFLQDVTERRQAQEKLRESEEKHRLLFEYNPLPMWIYDLETLAFLKVNDAAVQHYGYSREEFLRMTIKDIRPPEDVTPLLESISRVTLGIEHAGVWRHHKKDGTIIWVDVIAHFLQFDGRSSELVLAIDVTQRRRIENAEREQRAMAEALRHTAETLSSTLDYGEVLDQILVTVGSVVPSDAATIMILDEGKARVVRSRGYRERGLDAKILEIELSLVDTANLWQMLMTGRAVIIPDVKSYPSWKKLPDVEWIGSNLGTPISLRGEVIGFILLDSETPGYFSPIHAERLEAFANQAALAIYNSRLMQQAQEEITARKQAENALRESEQRYRLITQNAEDMIWTMDLSFQLLYVSPAVERALGYTAQEILTAHPEQFLTPESYSLGLEAFRQELESYQVEPDINYSRLLEMEYRHRDGSTFWVEMKFSFFRASGGHPIAVLGVGRDVTARRQVEGRIKDLLEFNEKILHHSPLGIFTYKVTGECIFANENAASIVGIEVEELKKQNFHRIQSWRESGLYDLITRAISTRAEVTADIHHKSTSGKDIWLNVHFVLFKSKSEDHVLLTISDITEQKRAEEKLRESEKRLILALSAAKMSVWEWDMRTNTVLLSPEFYTITGLPESAFDGTLESYTRFIHPGDVAQVTASAGDTVGNKTMHAHEFRILRPDGEVLWLASLGRMEYGPSGDPLHMIGALQDITQRKQVEMERQALLEIMQGLAATDDLHAIIELIHRSVGNVIYAENFFVVFHNRDTGLFEEIYSVDLYDPPAPPSKLEKSITSYVFRTGEPLLLSQELFDELEARDEVELVGTNSASWLGVPLKTSSGPIGVIVVQDYENPTRYSERDKNFLSSIATQVALAIERKQAEKEVRRSEERYRALFENSPISIWEQDFSQVKRHLDDLKRQGVTDFRSYFAAHPGAVAECTRMIGVLDVNNAGLQMYQARSKRELIESTLLELCQGELDHNAEDFIAIAEGRTSNGWEGADETMTGRPLEINLRWSVAPGFEQDFSKVIVTVSDITERKRAEQELKASEERFRQMADNIEEVFWVTDIQTSRQLYLSPACEKIWGCSMEHLMEKPDAFLNSVFAPDQPVVLYNLERQKNGEKTEMEYRIIRPDGSIRWIWDRAFPVFDEEGGIKVLAGIAADITARRQAEDALRESEERFSKAFEFAPIGKGLVSLDGRCFKVNRALCNLLGYTDQELATMSFQELTHPDDLEPDLKYVKRILQGEIDSYQVEKRYYHKSGAIVWAQLSVSVVRERNGRPSYFIAQVQDITERKNSEKEIARHLAELEALYENGLAVGRLLEPRQIGERILETFARHLSWHHVTIRLLNPGTDELVLIAFNQPGLTDQNRAEIEHRFGTVIKRVGQGLSGWVVQTGEPIRAGNVLEYPQYVVTYPGIKSGMYMPLRVGERTIGVISVESEESNALTVQDERLLTTLANQAAIAFENARLYQAAQQEITDRVEIEKKLRSSELHYRELADSITDILFELDQELRCTHWNKASEALTGIPAREAISKSMYELLGETEEQARTEKIYRAVLEENQAKTFESEIDIQDQKFVFEITANPSTRGVSVIARNITERKSSETLMQKRFELVEYSAHHSFEQVLQKTIDLASELTGSHIGFLHFVADDQSTIKLQTWSTETILEFCRADGRGMHYPLHQAGVWADAARRRQPIIHNDYESLQDRKGAPEGHAKVLREMVIPVIRNEKVVALLGVGNKTQKYTQREIEMAGRFADYAWDITERKQMESALAEERNQLARRVEERTADLSRANSNLARALRIKDEFLANMSHELRTPLNAILGLSESLAEQVAGPLNEKQQKYLSTINESGHHLLSLINDILDLAKIEAGQIALDFARVDLNSVCQASLRMIRQLAQKKNQEVTFQIDPELGPIRADERRLKQMIVNLLSNAVKFTPEFSRIGLEVHGDRAANQVIITVWDNGIGIQQEDLRRLFKPFVQLDSGLAREATGTGLGLALVAEMARLHGGSVQAASQPGQGSRFVVQLPWEPALADDMAARLRNTGKFRAVDPNVYRPTILLIEDTREVVMMLVDYLEMAGYKLVTAPDGIDGLAQAKATHPDLILMDIQMPRMDGFEAAQRLKSDPALRDIPIIALTALAMADDRQRCLDAGMDEYISKPVNLRALAKMIQKLLLLRRMDPS